MVIDGVPGGFQIFSNGFFDKESGVIGTNGNAGFFSGARSSVSPRGLYMMSRAVAAVCEICGWRRVV